MRIIYRVSQNAQAKLCRHVRRPKWRTTHLDAEHARKVLLRHFETPCKAHTYFVFLYHITTISPLNHFYSLEKRIVLFGYLR